jgi:hypothetical protein
MLNKRLLYARVFGAVEFAIIPVFVPIGPQFRALGTKTNPKAATRIEKSQIASIQKTAAQPMNVT